MLKSISERLGRPVPPDALHLHGSFVIAGQEVVNDIKSIKGSPRPDLLHALHSAPAGAIRAAISISPDTRRVIRELAPVLPAQLGGLPTRPLTEGLRWSAVSIDLQPKLSVHFMAQAESASQAAALRTTLVSMLQTLAKDPDVTVSLPAIKEVATLLVPEVAKDQLVLKLDQNNGGADKLMEHLIRPAAAGALTVAGRADSMNKLKTMLLALHNFHDNHSRFPPAASQSPDGKKLLSWRVHLLPYLEQDQLYKEFHLDEPWDSAHNRKLVERMPNIYLSPTMAGVDAKGMTPYLAPLGDKTIWDTDKGTAISRITDGTSNTIAIVEANPSKAVIWTKPDDLQIDMSEPIRGLEGVWPTERVFLAALCDGSVITIPESTPVETLRRLFQMNDGNPVELPGR